MKCKQAESRLVPYLDGKLSPRQREEMELHLRGCSSCTVRVKGFSEVFGLLNAWEEIEPSPSFDARLAQYIEQAPVSAGWWDNLLGRLANLPLGKPAFAAAMLAVVCLAAVLVGYSPAPPETLVSQQQQPAATVTAQGIDEFALYRNLPVLEDWDLLRDFEVLQVLSSTNPLQP